MNRSRSPKTHAQTCVTTPSPPPPFLLASLRIRPVCIMSCCAMQHVMVTCDSHSVHSTLCICLMQFAICSVVLNVSSVFLASGLSGTLPCGVVDWCMQTSYSQFVSLVNQKHINQGSVAAAVLVVHAGKTSAPSLMHCGACMWRQARTTPAYLLKWLTACSTHAARYAPLHSGRRIKAAARCNMHLCQLATAFGHCMLLYGQ